MTSQWIDTHLHLILPAQLHYDWIDDRSALAGTFDLADYHRSVAQCGIAQALFMEVDVREDEAEREIEVVAALAANPQSRIAGAIASCRPENPNKAAFAAWAERVTANAFVKGFRRVLHVMPDGLSGAPHFRSNLRRLTRAGHPFDLCMRADQLDEAYGLAKALDTTTFVLDHCGTPPIGSDLAAWRRSIGQLAELPNVNCKISGIIAHVPEDRKTLADAVADLKPVIDHCLTQFGFERVVWGSDWPVCNLGHGAHTWMDVTKAALAGATAAETQALAEMNARRLYRLPAITDR